MAVHDSHERLARGAASRSTTWARLGVDGLSGRGAAWKWSLDVALLIHAILLLELPQNRSRRAAMPLLLLWVQL